jgi:hypothetical protein
VAINSPAKRISRFQKKLSALPVLPDSLRQNFFLKTKGDAPRPSARCCGA